MRPTPDTPHVRQFLWWRPSIIGPLAGLLIGLGLLKLDAMLAFDPMNIPVSRAASGEVPPEQTAPAEPPTDMRPAKISPPLDVIVTTEARY